jgi:serine phosphatase RsbU (regulator of sigma subunit)
LALVLGDVSGKGVPAAMLMVKVSSELGVYLAREASPVAVLNAVNQRFLRRNTEGNFVTMVLAVLDLNEHAIELVIAGHIRPLLCRTDGSVVDVGDVEAGLPLGVESQHRYASTGLGVEVGQTLVLVSDGITEAENAQGEFFGLKRLRELVADTPASADEVGHRIIEAVDRFVGDHPQTDDRCVLCIHRHR